MAERVRCWEELKALGVPVHSVLEGGEVPELVANILASVAQEESRQIGERVSSTWQHVTGQGWAKTTRAPWGYRWRRATPEERAGGAPRSVLDIDPATAPYVRALFARVAAGESARGVARWAANLPDEARGGLGQPTDAPEPDRAARRMPWRTVQDVLRSPVYVGRPVHGDPDVLGRPRARWPQLVSDQVWQAHARRYGGYRAALPLRRTTPGGPVPPDGAPGPGGQPGTC